MYGFLRLSDGRRRAAIPVVVAVLLALTVLLGGCGGSSNSTTDGSEAPGTETELSSAEVPEATLALVGEEISLNLLSAPTVPTATLMANVLQGLLAYNPDGSTKNSLAKSWKEVSPTEYIYTLRSGPRFSTGKPVTIDDVLFSLKYEMDPKTGAVASSFFLMVKSIEKLGSNQIRVKLKKPDPTWPYVPGHYPAWIYEKQSLIDAGENLGGPDGIPVGSGPYAISEIASDHVTFVRNKYYDGPQPPVAKYVIRMIADPGTSLAAMQAGDVDGAIYVPLPSVDQWEAIPGVDMYKTVSPNNDAIWINTSKAPFDDPHVRRALVYAFDREGVTNSVFHGDATVFPTQVPPELWTNEMSAAEAEERADEMGREYPFDMAKAKAELAKSKHPDGFAATAFHQSSTPELGLALQALSESLKELNIDLTVRELGDTTYFNEVFEGNYELATVTGSYDYPDPLGLYYTALCSCAIPPNGFNASQYDNPKLDQLFDEAYSDTNKESRVDTLVDAVKVITEEAPLPMLWFRSVDTALKSDLVLTDLGPWSFFDTPWMASIGKAAS